MSSVGSEAGSEESNPIRSGDIVKIGYMKKLKVNHLTLIEGRILNGLNYKMIIRKMTKERANFCSHLIRFTPATPACVDRFTRRGLRV